MISEEVEDDEKVEEEDDEEGREKEDEDDEKEEDEWVDKRAARSSQNISENNGEV